MRRLLAILVAALIVCATGGHADALTPAQRAVLFRSGGKHAAAWSPKSVAGAILWLRADLGVTAPGGNVSSWADQTGVQTTPFSQSTPGDQPSVTTNAINGKPALNFVDVNRGLANGLFVSGIASAEGWIVCQAMTGGSIWDFGNTSSFGQQWFPFSTSNTIYDSFYGSARYDFTSSPAIPSSTWIIYAVKATAGGAWTAYEQGVQVYTTTGNTFSQPFGDAGFVYIGGLGAAESVVGQIAEVGISPVLSSGDAAKLRAYLTARYGISLGGAWP